MRARILVPIVLLLIAFCGALGFAVYSNISGATAELLNKQLDSTLEIAEREILQSGGGSLHDEDYQELVKDLGMVDGGMLIVDSDGKVIADSQQVMTGQNVSGLDWYTQAVKDLNSEFNAVFGQTDIYARSVFIDGKLLVSYLASQSIQELYTTPLYVIGVVGVISVVIVALLIYFIVTRLLINPVESFAEQIEDLPQGQKIDLKPLKRMPEITTSAEQLNNMLRGKPKKASDSAAQPEPAPEQLAAQTELQAEPAPGQAEPVPGQPEPAIGGQELQAEPVHGQAELVTGQPQPEPQAEPAPEQLALQSDPAFGQPMPQPEPALSQPAFTPGYYEPQLTYFELVDVVREAFEPLKQTVSSRNVRFSMLVDNNVPKGVFADRNTLLISLSTLLGQAINEAVPGSQVDARIACRPSAQALYADDIEIIGIVYYNGLEQTVMVEAKRG